MKFAAIGNYQVDYTTEEHRAKSLEILGHDVIRLQENKTTASQLIELIPEVDALFYSHTHEPSWEIDGLIDVFKQYKEAGVPTVSVHLDLWVGLERESDMGREASWFTEYFFVADGSPEAVSKYNELGINWHYLAPGVYEKECYIAEPDLAEYPHEIIFTGSKGYHPEHPFRPQLIDWLAETYGNRFGLYGNDGIKVVRGHELNTLYSSAKIVVGDSCFGGKTRYVSDRYFEVRGRGGFLLHPHVEGVDTHGVGYYMAQNLDSLQEAIDFYLEHDGIREASRKLGHEYVKALGTYTNRAEQMLGVIYG